MIRMLSLRGGGIRGYATAVTLAELERETGTQCAELFDLIVGTSIGGILATGLALKIKAKDLVTFFEVEGPNIFATNWLRRVHSIIGGPRYRMSALRKSLEGAFVAESKMAHVYTKLMVTSSRYRGAQSVLWKSWKHTDLSLVDVASASAAAPWFFGPAQMENYAYCDGGLWCNNPVAVGITECRKLWPSHGVAAIDIACPNNTSQFEPRRGSLLDVAPHLSNLFINFGEDAHTYMAKRWNTNGRIVTIEPPLMDASHDIGDASTANLRKLKQCAQYRLERNVDDILHALKHTV